MMFPQVGDKVVTRFGDTGEIIAALTGSSGYIRAMGYEFEGRYYNGPYIIRLEKGTLVGLKYDEFRRL